MAVELPTYKNTGIEFNFADASIGEVISKALPYVYGFAGIALLLMLILGGITLMTAAGNTDKTKSGYGMITGAVIGFIIVFISFFLVQLLEVVLGVDILG
jgi:hypothetical protein